MTDKPPVSQTTVDKEEISRLWAIMDRLSYQHRRAEEEMDLIEDQMGEVRKQLIALGDTDV